MRQTDVTRRSLVASAAVLAVGLRPAFAAGKQRSPI